MVMVVQEAVDMMRWWWLREQRADEVSELAGPLTYRFLSVYWVYGEWDHLNSPIDHHQTLMVTLSMASENDVTDD